MKHATQKYMNVTPAIAQDWLQKYRFERQRTLRQHHVQFLANLMRQGHFRPGSSVAIAVENGAHYLINGQHTLTAIVQSGVTITLSIETYVVSSMDEVAKLYTTFDTNLRRSVRDVMMSQDLPSRYNLTIPQTTSFASALPIILSGFDSGARSPKHPLLIQLRDPQVRQKVMDDWIPYASLYYGIFINCPKYIFNQGLRASVAALGITTFRYQAAKAETFWTQVAKQENLTASMPAYKLIQFLNSNPLFDLRMGYQYVRYCAGAWNAFFQGRTYANIKSRRLDLPPFIAGTPFSGKEWLAYFDGEKILHNPVLSKKSLHNSEE